MVLRAFFPRRATASLLGSVLVLTLVSLAGAQQVKPAQPTTPAKPPMQRVPGGRAAASGTMSAAEVADERQQLPERLSAVQARLQAKDTGAATQADQKAIVSLFDRLILASQRAERGEAAGGGGSSSPRGTGANSKPPADPEKPTDSEEAEQKPEEKPSEEPAGKPEQEESMASAAEDETSPTAIPGTRPVVVGDWGRLRPEEREPVLRALRDKFPPRYRSLVDQYFQSFPHANR